MKKSTNEKEINSVIELSGKDRYKYFIKTVVDWELAWGLYNDGWALAAADDNVPLLLLWPAREYAELCAVAEWANYMPRNIPLNELIDDLIPKLSEKGVGVGIFYTPSGQGTTPSLEQLKSNLVNYDDENYG